MERNNERRAEPRAARPKELYAGSDPARVVLRALLDARRRGLDDVSQTRFAVAAVLSVRPDLSPADAARAVELIRRRN